MYSLTALQTYDSEIVKSCLSVLLTFKYRRMSIREIYTCISFFFTSVIFMGICTVNINILNFERKKKVGYNTSLSIFCAFPERVIGDGPSGQGRVVAGGGRWMSLKCSVIFVHSSEITNGQLTS